MADKKPTEIASLGEFGLIDHLTDSFSVRNASTLRGVGDDAAVIAAGADEGTLCTTDLLLEGVDFDLTYFPLKHLGYKAVVVAVSDLLAMNGRPEQLLVSLGVSSKISVEALDDLYAGIRFACEEMEVDLVGGDTKASVTGLAIHVTALGRARKEEVVYRGGAKLHDLICITGNLGAAYMGLQLLEREKRVLRGVKDPEPEFKGNEYLLQRYLKPAARKDIVELLAEEKIVPTSMIDLSDGLASDLLQICKASKCGARIYLDRIPIARQTTAFAEEIHTDPVVAALNGGEDYELLFTVPLAFTGGFLALLISGIELSVVSLIGFVMLVGVIVNNGIVLVDYINQLRLEGMGRREAIIEAGVTRLRPILMTSLTTILGLIVMAFGNNVGTALMQPVALVCIGGLLYATLMTLLVVPCMYDILSRRDLRKVDEEELQLLDM